MPYTLSSPQAPHGLLHATHLADTPFEAPAPDHQQRRLPARPCGATWVMGLGMQGVHGW